MGRAGTSITARPGFIISVKHAIGQFLYGGGGLLVLLGTTFWVPVHYSRGGRCNTRDDRILPFSARRTHTRQFSLLDGAPCLPSIRTVNPPGRSVQKKRKSVKKVKSRAFTFVPFSNRSQGGGQFFSSSSSLLFALGVTFSLDSRLSLLARALPPSVRVTHRGRRRDSSLLLHQL